MSQYVADGRYLSTSKHRCLLFHSSVSVQTSSFPCVSYNQRSFKPHGFKFLVLTPPKTTQLLTLICSLPQSTSKPCTWIREPSNPLTG